MTDDEKKAMLEARRARAEKIGVTLYGPRYSKALAAGMGMSQEMVSHVTIGRRNASDQFEEALLAHAKATLPGKIEDLEALAGELGIALPARPAGVPKVATETEPAPGLKLPPHPRQSTIVTAPDPGPEPDPDDAGPSPSM